MKRLFLILSLLTICVIPVFANTITFSYYNENVSISTKTIPEESVKDSYLTGVYDAYVASRQFWPLHRIYDHIAAKKFNQQTYIAETKQKTAYYQGFYEFMYTYTAGTIGEFRDTFPQYRDLFKSGITYESACRIAKLGECVYYLRNVTGESSFKTADII